MGEGGDATVHAPVHHQTASPPRTPVVDDIAEEDWPQSPVGGASTPNPFSRTQTGIDLDDYFEGPRDTAKHSKWPLFMQMHGSIMPKMILPLIVVGAWATLITTLTMVKLKPEVNLGISNILLTVTGFVVGLGLSFRSSTAYERYAEGRRLWSQIILNSQVLGRCFWVHATNRPGQEKHDMLGKLTGMNLLVAFAVSLKHGLRFEPYTNYADFTDLIDHLDTFATDATNENLDRIKNRGMFKKVGESLGLSFAQSNPRKAMKKATSPLGNLPLEILCYLSAYVDELCVNGQMPVGMQQTAAYNAIQFLNDALVHNERVLNTPLPIAYAIAIQQITWLYVFLLPFQLLPELGWITIPATLAAAVIILEILFIGREIENPFGMDVNDLPLDSFCAQIVHDLEIITARPRPNMSDVIRHPKNKIFMTGSRANYATWSKRPEFALRKTLRNRPHLNFDNPQSTTGTGNSGATTTGSEIASKLNGISETQEKRGPESV